MEIGKDLELALVTKMSIIFASSFKAEYEAVLKILIVNYLTSGSVEVLRAAVEISSFYEEKAIAEKEKNMVFTLS